MRFGISGHDMVLFGIQETSRASFSLSCLLDIDFHFFISSCPHLSHLPHLEINIAKHDHGETEGQRLETKLKSYIDTSTYEYGDELCGEVEEAGKKY